MNGVIDERHDCEASGTKMPVQDLVRAWCNACGWDLSEPKSPGSFIDQKIDELEGLHGSALLDRVITASEAELRPRLRMARVAAFAVSILIMAAGPLIALAGLYLIIRGWPNIVLTLGGMLLLTAGWLLRPQLGSIPDDCLPRDEFPNLFSMVDGIAGQLSIKPIEHVRVDHRFNASLAQVGLARTPILTIGLPLWVSAAAQERVGLIGHEMAHRVNHDPARSTVVGWGLATLDRWLYLMNPANRQMQNPAEIVMRLLMRLLGGVIGGLRRLLAKLLFRDSQSAEYLADHLTARIAGPVATVKLLSKAGLGRNLEAVAWRAYYAGDIDGGSVIDAFHSFVETVPEREMERIRRADEEENSRIDSAHPPTASRIKFIKSRHFELPLVILSDSLSRAIDEELQPFRERFSMRLMDHFIARH